MNTIIRTKDNSHTLFSEVFGENYHSLHGALQESQHVFIKNGLEYLADKKKLTILEVGMGSGLNVLLTALHPLAEKIHIQYIAIEPYPLDWETMALLNYPDLMPEPTLARQVFRLIHQIPEEVSTALTPEFQLLKVRQTLQDFQTDSSFDLVYYDAFAPAKQAEMWEKSVFEKIASLMNPNGILVTYCAKGQFKRNLKESGFVVEPLPGPKWKREMTRGRWQ